MVVAAAKPLAQMGFEDDYAYSTGSYGSSTSHLDITRYALGARGIDRIEKVVDSTSSSPTTVTQYPLYDAHGNVVATLAKGSSAGTYTVGNQRAFEPWGSVFDSSVLSNTPKQAYCASLGHVADSELGFTYMRARYYEPTTGRFISEDPNLDGNNVYIYALNDPTNKVDANGRDPVLVAAILMVLVAGIAGSIASFYCGGQNWQAAVAGFIEGATVAVSTLAKLKWMKHASIVCGALVGAIAGAFEAWRTGGDVIAGALCGAAAGALGGCIGAEAAVLLRQLEVALLLGFDEGTGFSLMASYSSVFSK